MRITTLALLTATLLAATSTMSMAANKVGGGGNKLFGSSGGSGVPKVQSLPKVTGLPKNLGQPKTLIPLVGNLPAVNQIPWSPGRHDPVVLAESRERGVVVEGYSPLSDTDLDDLQRLSAAHAVAAQALRGLVHTMLKRRGKIAEPAGSGTGGVEE